MQLADALRFSNETIAAFVGAGGKTTAMFIAARELSNAGVKNSSGRTVLVTTTTHLGAWQKELADHDFQVNLDTINNDFYDNLPAGVILLYDGQEKDRLVGINLVDLSTIHHIATEKHIPLLIEADGAGMRPLKAPSGHEPVIPDFIQAVVVVAGLSGLGKPLTQEWVHRAEQYANIAGMSIGDTITADALVDVLVDESGGLKNIPSSARRILLLNQADNDELIAVGGSIAQRIKGKYSTIVISSLGGIDHLRRDCSKITDRPKKIHAVVEPIGGIILAAGGSNRYGAPKQLLPWKGKPFIRHVTMAALEAGLSPVVVVTGGASREIENVISDLPAQIIENTAWETGLSSSIQAGIKAFTSYVGGAVFLQADQPQTSVMLIRKLVETHQVTLAPIIAPQIDGQRGNPVLFDRQTFSRLLVLAGENGGKTLFQDYPIQWVTWHDAAQLLDVDTPEDYRKFLEMYDE